MARPIVAVVQAEYDQHLAGNLDTLVRSSTQDEPQSHIVLKVNLCDIRGPETGAILHPQFLDSLLQVLRGRFPALDIFIVESDATVVLPDLVRDWYGFTSIIKRWDARWVNLTRTKHRTVTLNGTVIREVQYARIFDDAYFISVAKMKTNSLSTISASLKNQFGCLPEVKKAVYHPRLADVIVDVNRVFRPDLCIVDGIIGMGGSQGPAFGLPIHSKVIVGGCDPVAVDATCAALMGFNPKRIAHLVGCARAGLGSINAKVVSDVLLRPDHRFRPSWRERATVVLGQAFKTMAVSRWREAW